MIDYYYSVKTQHTVENVTLFDVILLPECSVYEGHFPGMPVAPGVCNIQMIKECVERITGQQLLLESITQCKFTTMITPQQHRELQIRIELTEIAANKFKVTATIGQDETAYMMLKGEFVTSLFDAPSLVACEAVYNTDTHRI